MSVDAYYSLLTIELISSKKQLKNVGGTHYPLEQVLPWLAHNKKSLVKRNCVNDVLPTVEIDFEIAEAKIREDVQERGGVRGIRDLFTKSGETFLGYLVWTNNGNGTAKVGFYNHLARICRGHFFLPEELL